MSANTFENNKPATPNSWSPGKIVNTKGSSPILLVCEHATNVFPPGTNDLGCTSEMLRQHIAIDIGAEALTYALSERLNSTAVLCGASRLYVDCNRVPSDGGWIPESSDSILIPGNQSLDEESRDIRRKLVFEPFHALVAQALKTTLQHSTTPMIVTIHSFTPVMAGFKRPWEMAVIWRRENPAKRMIDELRKHGVIVGDNEPYDGRLAESQTFYEHADPKQLPHFALEVRQDLLMTDEDVAHWTNIIASSLKNLFKNNE